MILKSIKQTIHKIMYNSKCFFGKGVILDSKNFFEGMNKLGDNTTFLHSSLGFASYVSEYSFIKNCKIGKYSSIGPHVRTVIGTHPSKGFVSTHPAFYSKEKQCGFSYVEETIFGEYVYIDEESKYSILIGNDVWIGENVTILQGVKIGDGAIVATGAVVVKDVPSYSVVGGVPAHVIRYRFDDETINKLEKYQWWNKKYEWIENHVQIFSDYKRFINIIDDETL